jgi:hypothetical protein
MYTLEKQRSVSVRDTDKSHVKVSRRKEALRKLAHYLRNERNYSEKEIRKFMAETFIGEVDY